MTSATTMPDSTTKLVEIPSAAASVLMPVLPAGHAAALDTSRLDASIWAHFYPLAPDRRAICVQFLLELLDHNIPFALSKRDGKLRLMRKAHRSVPPDLIPAHVYRIKELYDKGAYSSPTNLLQTVHAKAVLSRFRLIDKHVAVGPQAIKGAYAVPVPQ